MRAAAYTEWFKQHQANVDGRDFVVGDIHGYFHILEALLAHVDFDPHRDRLFCVGDLIDRGPASERAGEFLAEPWLHSIRGNHEQMLIHGAHTVTSVARSATRNWLANGGDWFFRLPLSTQNAIYRKLQALPAAMEITLPDDRRAGIVHGDVLRDSWPAVRARLTDSESGPKDVAADVEALVWSRSRAFAATAVASGERNADDVTVDGVDVVFFGHTPMKYPLAVANTRWLDTGVCHGKALSLAELGVDGHVWSLSVDGRSLSEGWTIPGHRTLR